MPPSRKRPPEEDGGFLFYVVTLVVAFAVFAGMLVWASKHLWK